MIRRERELGEIALARGVEELLDSVEVEEERVTAGAREEREAAGRRDMGFIAEERDRNVREDLFADGFGRLGVIICREIHIDGLLAIDEARRRHS